MYTPKQFDEPRIEVMHELIRARPLATLVVLTANGLDANHIPLHLSADSSKGILRGHVARSNPVWKEYKDAGEALAIFHGPESYISPSWYASKKESGKVVPTWNYAVVHAYGDLKIIDDVSWIKEQLELLTTHNESSFDNPWSVSDAPQEYTDNLLRMIVGIEIQITKLQGKWKVSQNQSLANQETVIQGLESSEVQNGKAVADLVRVAGKNDAN